MSGSSGVLELSSLLGGLELAAPGDGKCHTDLEAEFEVIVS